MQRRNLIVLGVAVFFGLLAVYLANAYFSGIEKREERVAQQQQLVRIAVASQPLEFATPLTSDNIKLVNWPETSVPQGAFRTIDAVLRDGRVALRPIAVGEPILADRVSGKDGRAALSYNLPDGMRAISIPVSAVTGVSGFVLPGDVVDVMLTRQIAGEGATDSDKMIEVILESVKVLAIDHMANDKATNPKVGKTAVVEVDMLGAQKLTLARELGALTLALRNIEHPTSGWTRAVTSRDVGRRIVIPARREAPVAPPVVRVAATGGQGVIVPMRPTGPSMLVVRGTQGTNYEVNRNGGW